jgi:multidrug efflux pump subunit AcrB
LGHQRLILLGFGATVAVAVASYVMIPKGFFPLQDTAFVFATTEAAQDIGFEEMAAKHQQLAKIAAEDPALQAYNHAVGATGGSQTLSNGRFWFILKDRGDRDVDVRPSSTAAREDGQRAGHHRVHAPRRTSTSVPGRRAPSTSTPCAARIAASCHAGPSADRTPARCRSCATCPTTSRWAPASPAADRPHRRGASA